MSTLDSITFQEKFSVLSLNCRGLSNVTKRHSIKNSCKKSDVLLLQETHGTKQTNRAWTNSLNRKESIFSQYSSAARGAAVLFNHNVNPKIIKTLTDNNGRIAACVCEISAGIMGFISVYAPNVSNSSVTQNDYVTFLYDLENILMEIKNLSLIHI